MKYRWSIGNTEGGPYDSVSEAIREARTYVRAHPQRLTLEEYWGEDITFQILEGSAAGRGHTILSWRGKVRDFIKPNWTELAS